MRRRGQTKNEFESKVKSTVKEFLWKGQLDLSKKGHVREYRRTLTKSIVNR